MLLVSRVVVHTLHTQVLVYTAAFMWVWVRTHMRGTYTHRVDSFIEGEDIDMYACACVCVKVIIKIHLGGARVWVGTHAYMHVCVGDMHAPACTWHVSVGVRTDTQQSSASCTSSPHRPPCPIQEPDPCRQCSWHERGRKVWWLGVQAAWMSLTLPLTHCASLSKLCKLSLPRFCCL